MVKILDGKAAASVIKENMKYYIQDRNLKLIIFQAGDNPASNVYIRNKQRACEEVGIESVTIKVSDPDDLKAHILSNVDNCDAMMLQLPLPEGYGDEQYYIDLIPPEKDADCLTSQRLGELFLGSAEFAPCTAQGIMDLLDINDIEVEGKHVVIVGRSNIVGKPIAHLMLEANATVTVCHSRTKNLEEFTRSADILVVAIGQPKFIKADMVKEGAVVIDVGINRMDDGKLCGDVDFDDVLDKVSAITPVPGGCGVVTVAELLANTVSCAEECYV